MTYPHIFTRESVLTGCGWPYRCRCGLGSPTPTGNADEQDGCPSAMRDHIADLSRHEASIHKAAARAVEAERAAVVKWLRESANAVGSDGGRVLSPAGRGLLLLHADEIERGDHIKEQA